MSRAFRVSRAPFFVAGAAVVSIDDWDRQISDWAVENTPIFGSPDRALEASDNLRTATTLTMVGTALAVPNGDGAWETRSERLVLEGIGNPWRISP